MSGHTEAFEKQNAICDVSEVVAMDVAFMVVATYVSIVVDPAAGTHLLRSSRRRRKTKIRVRCLKIQRTVAFVMERTRLPVMRSPATLSTVCEHAGNQLCRD